MKTMILTKPVFKGITAFIIFFALTVCSCTKNEGIVNTGRTNMLINQGWQFFKYDSLTLADNLIYDVRPAVDAPNIIKEADAKPTEAVEVEAGKMVLKNWILPTANGFIADSANKHIRPGGNPGADFSFVQPGFDDSNWQQVNLPHDWAIDQPFMVGWNTEVSGGMGRLPSSGVGWYRKKIDITNADTNKCIYLDIEGAMSYAMVWLNGNLVGGWPYGYASWRVNLTPYIVKGQNQIAIRVDNPNHSARWYPGGGLYRNVWLTKTNKIHVSQWGTFITTNNITKKQANVNIEICIDNNTKTKAEIKAVTNLFLLDTAGNITGKPVAKSLNIIANCTAGGQTKVSGNIILNNPKLWGPCPTQKPNLYIAVTQLYSDNKIIDTYKTRFGVRNIVFDANKGIIVNDELIKIKGVNQHHDLGALGAAFNVRAAQRQLELLREMGCNAIRMSHNPPAPGLLELTDRMGFLVIDEIFDSWELKKTPHDFHLIFADWSEPDTRAFIRRDRNCPSVIMWSFGNEVGEQYTGHDGAKVAQRIHNIIKHEDPTRPTTLAMNYAKPDMPLPVVPDIISLNYQGEGIRQDPEFEGTDRIRTAPQYNVFHKQFPDKVILSSETASAFSSRGVYFFPVTPAISSPTRDGRGGNSQTCQVSSYELYAVDFGSSADKVFKSVDSHPFVAGEFVWTGWDYIGEPTPYYWARSSYTGIIDLAGFKKDRFYLYQAKWRPELPMVHILPHWNWPTRVGQITPVHVFTSGNEVELFVNGISAGRKKKAEFEYRLRWDSVVYQPGELKAVAYKNGKHWAEQIIKTTGNPVKITATADRSTIFADGNDLSFITVKVCDADGLLVPQSNNLIDFSIDGPGIIVATDNGNAACFTTFASHKREAFNGLALVIVKAKKGTKDKFTVIAKSGELNSASVIVNCK